MAAISREVMKQCTQEAHDLIVLAKPKRTILEFLVRKRSITHDQAERAYKAAKDLVIEDLNRPRIEHLAEQFAFFKGVMASSEANTRDRLIAAKEIDSIMVLNGRSGQVLNQINVVASASAGVANIDTSGAPEDVPIGELDSDARRNQIRLVAERVRARNLSSRSE
ncbi:hypothetical protein SH668x_001219 [Planctomicrobium sp. SH668]|uniref:hypothetical protein n=1 Tax=Planctomicrobium sp. SH668 TaxID=3448126 RepID=UPI003F5B08EA